MGKYKTQELSDLCSWNLLLSCNGKFIQYIVFGRRYLTGMNQFGRKPHVFVMMMHKQM